MWSNLFAVVFLLHSSLLFAAPMPEPSLQSNARDLEQAADWYLQKVSGVDRADECFPMLISREQSINLMYLHCSPEAFASEGKGVKVSENFSVSDELARRFHFWRRIYSLWSHQQYVLHAADYPDVVFEIGDTSSLADHVKDMARHRLANKVLNQRRAQYRALLNRMHQLRSTPEQFTKAMQRIAVMMQPISDEQKYAKAALSLRIQRGQRTMIATGLTTASRYMSAVEKAFIEEGIPQELSKIAFIESSFNLKARSKVGASGVYQIMPATGREFLMVTEEIDERNDPIKAAHAAARLLRQNFQVTNSWALAVTGYNHGVNGIRRAVREVGSDRIEDLIARYDGPAFGFASKNFFTGFMGLIATVAEADSIFPEVPRLAPLQFSEIRIPRPTSIRELAKQYQLTHEIILDFNPDLNRYFVKSNGTLPRGYVLKIPAISIASVE
jgi:membrane-bound lytic murein transglycosylase D